MGLFFEGRRKLDHPRLAAFDLAADRLADRVRTPAADRVFYTLTNAAEHGRLWLGVAAVRAALVPRHRRTFGRFAAAIAAESILTNGVVKTAFRRVRPDAYFVEGPLPYRMRRPRTSAFPSGHSTSAFTAATLLAADDEKMAPAYYTLAALVAASRVYVRMHHASDVVAGAALGTVFARLARRHVTGS